jgi:RHS repeat-associated protein
MSQEATPALAHLPRKGPGRSGSRPSTLIPWVVAGWILLGGLARADKSGVGGGAASLPGGPGSFEGLGESFQAMMSTGTGSHSVPLAATVGAGGLAPHLSLSYDGGGGNGVLGLGWSFGPGSIQRRSDKGIPRYVDGPNGLDDDQDGTVDDVAELDRFLSPSGEELVPLPDGAVTNYFCKVEGEFTRYRRVADYWEGTTASGHRLIFGRSPSARIADPSDPSHIFQWLLEAEADVHGNTLEFLYSGFPGDANLNEKYLVQVRYGGGPGPWENFHFVALTYEDRQDWFEDCRAGFPVHLGRRLVQVDMGTQGPELAGHARGDFNHDGIPDSLNRRYRITYDPASYRSLITSVTRFGADGVTAFPSTSYAYTAASTESTFSAAGRVITSLQEPVSTFETGFAELVDLNGDGLPDLLRTDPFGGGHYGFLNQGQSGAAPGAIVWGPQQVVIPGNDGLAWSTDLGQTGTHLADIDGDGLPDLVQVGINTVYWYRNSPTFGAPGVNWLDRAALAVQDFPPPAPFDNPDVRTADINFDKRIDIIRSVQVGESVAYEIWFNLGKQKYSSRVTTIPARGYRFSDTGVMVGDYNGDRIPDIARIRPTGIEVTAGLGYGRFTDMTFVALPDAEALTDAQVARARLEDVTGDGLEDLVVENAEPGTLWFWVNQGNYTLSARRTITDLPLAVGTTQVRWADMNGNGTVDLVVADDGGSPRLRIVDLGLLLGYAPRPNLLTEIRNGLGAVTRLEYRSSVDSMLEDGTGDDGTYRYAWPYALPFPVEVVSRITTSDSLGHTETTRFSYHDGYYDPVEKQFRGFGRAESEAVGDATCPTLVTRHTFDVGAGQLALKGRVLHSSVETEDGQIFSESDQTWSVRIFGIGLNGVPSTWAAPVHTVTRVFERGAGTVRVMENELEYDGYGNVVTARDWGLVDGANRLFGDDERITTTTFAYNTNAWLLHVPWRSEVADAAGHVVSRSERFYDDETFAGNNPGVATKGDLTLVREWSDPAVEGAFIRSGRTRYDAYGNPAARFDPLADPARPELGHWREFAFDPRFHQYALREVQHVGGGHPDLVIQAEFDEGFGITTRVTDANGNPSLTGYDVFGRTVWEVEPGDTVAFPTREYRYVEALSVAGGGVVNYTESRQLDRAPGSLGAAPHDAYYHLGRTYLDGLGRSVLFKAEAEPDPDTGAARWVATGALQFNLRGLPTTLLEPYFADSPDYEDPGADGWTGRFHVDGRMLTLPLASAPRLQTTYDALGRMLRSRRPDGAVAETRFEPLVARSFDENGTDPSSPDFGRHTATYRDGLGRTYRIDEVQRVGDDGRPVADLATWTTRYQFRADDVVLSVTDAQGNVKSRTFDGLGRVLSVDDWDHGHGRFAYDDASNQLEREDAKGQVTRFAYDGANRLVSVDYVDEGSGGFSYGLKPDVVYTYDLPTGPVDLGDGSTAVPAQTLGRLVSVRDTQGEEHFSYDLRGRMSWSVRRLPDPVHHQPVSYTTRQEFDSLGRITRLTYPDNDFVTFDYGERLLLRAIGGGPTAQILQSRTYTPAGQEWVSRYGNGVVSSRAFDTRLRMTAATVQGPGQARPDLMDYRYHFDPASNIRRIEDARADSVIPEGNPRRNTQTFEYDGMNRLAGYALSLAAPGGAPRVDGRIHYRYDRIGNLLEQTSDLAQEERGWSVTDLGVMSYGGSKGTANRVGRDPATPGPHAVTRLTRGTTSRDLAYDGNGNLVRPGAGAAYTWDFADRLVGYADPGIKADYRYDYRGRRVLKSVASLSAGADPQATVYVSRAYEVRPHDEVVKYVFDGARRIAQITGRVNAGTRLGRLRLSGGWNLCGLAGDVSGVGARMTGLGAGAVDAVWRWNADHLEFELSDPAADAGAGTVFWIHATQPLTLALPETDPLAGVRDLSAGGTFFAGVGPVPLDLGAVLPPQAAVWRRPSGAGAWDIRHGLSADASVAGVVLAPGEAAFVSVPAATSIASPATRIRYYHDDHLGSQTVVTDEAGRLVQETAFYPFGQTRYRHVPRGETLPYGFGGKELDAETGLNQFEARYLATALGRFISADPTEQARSPQGMNGYAYADNRPTAFNDPSGLVRERPGPARPTRLKQINEGYRNGREEYVSEAEHMPHMGQVVKFGRFERRQMKVTVNKRGLLVYASSGQPVDTSEGHGIVGRSREQMQDQVLMFVQTKAGHMYMAQAERGKYHHSSFTGGKDIGMAGEMRVKKGVIDMVNNSSGHYTPELDYLHAFKQWINAHPNKVARASEIRYETPVINGAPPRPPAASNVYGRQIPANPSGVAQNHGGGEDEEDDYNTENYNATVEPVAPDQEHAQQEASHQLEYYQTDNEINQRAQQQ